MTDGQLIKHQNLIKWILQTEDYGNTTTQSDSFVIMDRKCYFSFDHGMRDWKPLGLMIRFNENQKLHSPMEVIILVSSNSKTLPPERHTITDECEVKLWSSFDYDDIRGSLVTFEMIINDFASKDDKAVQTSPYIDIKVQSEAVSKDFSALFYAGPNRDAEFLCGEETIKAHKDVICCRSTVFASMLGTDMQEGKTGQIKIQDMESSIFRQFLQYLYTGMFPDLTYDAILRMYQAADKYAVDSLKKQCATFLTDNLSLENACEVLILSDRHNDMDLKKFVIEYMLNEEIPRRIGESWIDFSKENMTLANEVLYTYYMNSSRAGHPSEK